MIEIFEDLDDKCEDYGSSIIINKSASMLVSDNGHTLNVLLDGLNIKQVSN